MADLLALPQRSGLATLVLIDEVLMYAHGKVAKNPEWRTVLANFFQYLSQAAVATDRCAVVASFLASDTALDDAFGRELSAAISDRVDRQKEEPIQPVGKDDVPEVLRRRFFEPDSIARPEEFRPHAIAAVKNMIALDPGARKEARAMEARVGACYPFHPDIAEIFYTKWTQIDGFQRTRGILRAFAVALRDAEAWDDGPLAGPALFLAPPGKTELSGAARDMAETATRAAGGEDGGNDWAAVLESELDKARRAQTELGLANREIEQAAMAAFLCSQPIGQKASTRELAALAGAAGPDRIAFGKALRRWAELSWFLDETEFAPRREPPESLAPRQPPEPDANARRRPQQPRAGGNRGANPHQGSPRREKPDARRRRGGRARSHAARAAARHRRRRRVPLRRPGAGSGFGFGEAERGGAALHRGNHRGGQAARQPQRAGSRRAVARGTRDRAQPCSRLAGMGGGKAPDTPRRRRRRGARGTPRRRLEERAEGDPGDRPPSVVDHRRRQPRRQNRGVQAHGGRGAPVRNSQERQTRAH